MDGPILAEIGKEILMRGVMGFVGGGLGGRPFGGRGVIEGVQRNCVNPPCARQPKLSHLKGSS